MQKHIRNEALVRLRYSNEMRSPMISFQQIAPAVRLSYTYITLNTVSISLSKEFVLKSGKPARNICLLGVMKKNTEHCQMIWPLDSRNVGESIISD